MNIKELITPGTGAFSSDFGVFRRFLVKIRGFWPKREHFGLICQGVTQLSVTPRRVTKLRRFL